MIKVLERVRLRETCLNRPAVDIIPNEEKLKAVPLKSRVKWGYLLPPLLFLIVLKVLAEAIK